MGILEALVLVSGWDSDRKEALFLSRAGMGPLVPAHPRSHWQQVGEFTELNKVTELPRTW